jgi:hypothetical protein
MAFGGGVATYRGSVAEVQRELAKLGHEFKINWTCSMGRGQYNGSKAYDVNYWLDGSCSQQHVSAESAQAAKFDVSYRILQQVKKEKEL